MDYRTVKNMLMTIVCSIALSATSSHARIIDFEGLRDNKRILDGYGGMYDWNSYVAINTTKGSSALIPAATFGPTVAVYSGYGTGAFSSWTPFNIGSMDVTGFGPTTTISVEGYNAGELLYTKEVPVNSIKATTVKLNWHDIDQISVNADGGYALDRIVIAETLEELKPAVHALVIGARDNEHRGDVAALGVGASLESKNAKVTRLLVDVNDAKANITLNEIRAAMTTINDSMSEGDTFVLYVNAHGNSLEDARWSLPSWAHTGIGSEFFKLGKTRESLIYDEDLAKMMSSVFGDRQKISFLDFCHSGGFIRPSGFLDPYDQGTHFNSLVNSLVITSARESGNSHYDTRDGISFFSQAVSRALSDREISKYTAASLYERIVALNLDIAGLHVVSTDWGLSASAEVIEPNLGLIALDFEASNDFGITGAMPGSDPTVDPAPIGSIPEPASISLLLTGLFAFWMGSKKRSRRANVFATDKSGGLLFVHR